MSDRSIAPPAIIACHECGTIHPMRRLARGEKAHCRCCGAVLYRARVGSIERALNFNLAALMLFAIANLFPLLSFEMEGRVQVADMLTGVRMLYERGFWELAVLVLLVATVIPLLKVLGSVYVLAPLHFGRRPPGGATVFRLVETLHPWAMMEVYLLGLLVAYVKLSELATIGLGISLYAFVGLIILMVASDAALEPQEVWQRFGRQADARLLEHGRERLVSCHACAQLVVMPQGPHHDVVCPRCGAALHRRKPDSLTRTWALVITASILYIPANVLPVMSVVTFGNGEPDTILSGVKVLIAAGMWPVALLVFFASITVPVLKLIGLTCLLFSVQRGSRWRPRDRTFIYRIIEGVGRWSMVDIFMISILVALVDLGSIATIHPGAGAISFACVVVITMFASMSFDPRLIWDREEEASHGHRLVRV